MPDMIRDGSGQAYQAKVNENQRLFVSSLEKSDDYAATEIGNSYNINTGSKISPTPSVAHNLLLAQLRDEKNTNNKSN